MLAGDPRVSSPRRVASVSRLPQAFYARDALEVAGELLGMVLVRGGVALRITEVEAYRSGDTASHCRFGRTARNAPMWGPGGHVYVYLCYGVHQMLNIVTGAEGEGAAVLVRACEPVRGLPTIRARRGGLEGPALLTGPGKVGAALAIDTSFSGHALFCAGGLEVWRGSPPDVVLEGARIGVDYARPADRDAPWRLAAGDSVWISHRARLRPRRRP